MKHYKNNQARYYETINLGVNFTNWIITSVCFFIYVTKLFEIKPENFADNLIQTITLHHIYIAGSSTLK